MSVYVCGCTAMCTYGACIRVSCLCPRRHVYTWRKEAFLQDVFVGVFFASI